MFYKVQYNMNIEQSVDNKQCANGGVWLAALMLINTKIPKSAISNITFLLRNQ